MNSSVEVVMARCGCAPERMRDDFDLVARPPAWRRSVGDNGPVLLTAKVSLSSVLDERLPISDIEIDRCIGIEGDARHIHAESPVENVVERKITEVADAIRTGRLTCVRMGGSDQRRMKSRVSLTQNKAQERFHFRRPSEQRAVAGAVLEAVRKKYLSRDHPANVQDPDADLELPLIDVESHSSGAAKHESEGVKRRAAIDIKG